MKEEKTSKKPLIINKQKQNRVINLQTETKNQKNELFSNILLKGKLFKAINTHLIFTNKQILSIKNNNINTNSEKQKRKFTSKFPNIFTNDNPNLIKREINNPRFEDFYVTPDELITQNFSKREISNIIANPAYFKINKTPIKSSKILGHLDLKDTIEKEERENKKRFEEKLFKKRKNHKLNLKDFTVTFTNNSITTNRTSFSAGKNHLFGSTEPNSFSHNNIYNNSENDNNKSGHASSPFITCKKRKKKN